MAAIAVVVAAEAVALLTAAGWYLQGLLTQPAQSIGGAVFTMMLLLLCAGWLLAVGHYLFRGYRWTRAAALVGQFFMLAVGIPTLFAGILLPGILMVVPPAAVIIMLFTPAVLGFTSRPAGKTPVL